MRAYEIAGIRADFEVAACSSDPELFDQVDYRSHLDAREVCFGCASRGACLEIAQADREADGTYGGVLFMNGQRILEIR